MTVREMMTRMDSKEFTGWQAYWKVQPFGRDCDDISRAVGFSLLANINRDTDKKPEPFELTEFLPFLRQIEEKAQATDEQKAIMHQLTLVLGAPKDGDHRQDSCGPPGADEGVSSVDAEGTEVDQEVPPERETGV